MPAPDLQGLDIDERLDGSFTLTAEIWPYGNRRVRIARMLTIRRNILRGGWKCSHCGDLLVLVKRADARFCGDGCRKRAARKRRKCRGQQ